MPHILTTCVVSLCISLSPAPTNQACYTSQAYRDTHEQECLINQTHAGHSDDHHDGLIGGLLHRIGSLL